MKSSSIRMQTCFYHRQDISCLYTNMGASCTDHGYSYGRHISKSYGKDDNRLLRRFSLRNVDMEEYCAGNDINFRSAKLRSRPSVKLSLRVNRSSMAFSFSSTTAILSDVSSDFLSPSLSGVRSSSSLSCFIARIGVENNKS
jgi:hypothetical protein